MTALWEAEVNKINKYLSGEKIPEWLGRGRIVLLPRSNNLTMKDKYRPITYLYYIVKELHSCNGRHHDRTFEVKQLTG